MRNRASSGTMSLIIVLLAFLLICLGIFWLLNGLGGENSGLVLKGSFSLFGGLTLGAIANFLKF